jgi:hypothetical protein
MGKYSKAISAVILATIIAAIPILKSGPISVVSELNIGVAFLSALLVYLVPNIPSLPWLKTAVAAIMAGVAFLVTVVGADCSSLAAIFHCVALANWMQCGIMVLKAANVYIVPNVDTPS